MTGALAGNATAIVQSGAIEFDPAPGNSALSVDIAGATVRIFNNSPSTSVTFDLAAEYGVTLDGPLALSIVGVTAAANGVTAFTAGSVTRTPHSVVFTATGTTWPAGASLTISLETSCLDIDGSGSNDALTDGLLLLRYLFGLRGAPLIDSALGPGATRTTAAEVESYLAGIAPALDVDGDGSADALTDGLLMLRYFFGLRGGPLVAAAIGPNATRGDATLIEAHLHGLVTAPFNQPPQVSAGSDQSIALPDNASLSAQVVDDGLPNPPGTLALSWMMVSGPGTVSFANPAAPTTNASFSVAGTYVLRLTASDGAASAASDITVTVAPNQGPGPDPSTLAPPI
ncbi:MAG: hypothetical protein KAX84_04565, partial [Burkholderiales bacterium]|nr:hypothetical protein [Burkholderiales bacterium]